jgi:hypothetical protein
MTAAQNVVSLPPTGAPSTVGEEPVGDPVRDPLWRQLGVDHVRLAIVDTASREPLVWRWLHEGVASSGDGAAKRVEHALPGADALLPNWVEHLAGAPEEVITHLLSPRRFAYFWRLDDRHAVLAQVHFRSSRSGADEYDNAGVRVLCEHWLAADLQRLGVAWAVASPTPWNRVERRARLALPWQRRLVAGALGSIAALALWQWLGTAPALEAQTAAQQRRIGELVGLANGALQASAERSLAGQDFERVQDALTDHRRLGHFESAAVTNARQQVVAHAGFAPAPPIGQALPPSVRDAARVVPLRAGGTALGELIIVEHAAVAAAATDAHPASAVRLGAALTLLLVAAGGVALWHTRRARDRAARSRSDRTSRARR